MPVIELIDVVNDNIAEFNTDCKYAKKPLVTNIYTSPPKKWDYFVLMSYTKKEMDMFGEFNLIDNFDCDFDFIGKDAVYIELSNLILDLIWTYMD